MSFAEGLVFKDPREWRRWADGRGRVVRVARGIKHRAGRAPTPDSAVLWESVNEPQILLVIDLDTASCRFAAHALLRHLDPATTAVLAPASVSHANISDGRSPRPWQGEPDVPTTVTEVASLGSYLPLAGQVAGWARAHDVRHCVIQHGLLTPWAPPPGPGEHLMCWSDADARFWTAGQSGVAASVVGSQMLWHAASRPPASLVCETPIMLGQLHGIELSKKELLHTYWRFCRSHRVDYRPHPNERDAVSRALHRVMRAGGINFDPGTRPVAELGRPVVSVFSTGVLEAAHSGLPAWVAHSHPPAWLRAFWQRYRLAPWGGEPTPAWAATGPEPARVVADELRR